MKLNLGCGDRHLEGFVNVDIAQPADRIVDLASVWPWQDSSVENVQAIDVCEHVQDSAQLRGATTADRYREDGSIESSGHAKFKWVSGRIHFMNELHRVLVPGGRATIETPNAAKGSGFWQDPTHTSGYCLSTFKYFERGAFAHGRLAKSYGITAAFKILSLEECRTSGEFSPLRIHGAPSVEPPIGVWVPAQGETAWKIRAVLEAVK